MTYLCGVVQADGSVGCGKEYASAKGLKKHEDFCLGKTCRHNLCEEVFYSQSAYNDHTHFECETCGKKLYTIKNADNHKASHPSRGDVYSLAFELYADGDPEIVRKAEKLHKKFLEAFPDLDTKANEMKSGVYSILHPISELPNNLKDFAGGFNYLGKSTYKNQRILGRFYDHNSSKEKNKKLLDLYDECHKKGTSPIFIELFKNCSPTKAKIIENVILLAICYSNLANINHGEDLPLFFKNWSLDKRALLGAKILDVAYEEFCKIKLSSHRRITYHRQKEARSRRQYLSVKQEEEPPIKQARVDDNESLMRKYAMLKGFEQCEKFLLEHTHLCDYSMLGFLTVEALSIAIEFQDEEMSSYAANCITLQYLLELVKSLNAPGSNETVIKTFFKKIRAADPSYMKMYDDEVESFKERLTKRAKTKRDAALAEAESEERT